MLYLQRAGSFTDRNREVWSCWISVIIRWRIFAHKILSWVSCICVAWIKGQSWLCTSKCVGKFWSCLSGLEICKVAVICWCAINTAANSCFQVVPSSWFAKACNYQISISSIYSILDTTHLKSLISVTKSALLPWHRFRCLRQLPWEAILGVGFRSCRSTCG